MDQVITAGVAALFVCTAAFAQSPEPSQERSVPEPTVAHKSFPWASEAQKPLTGPRGMLEGFLVAGASAPGPIGTTPSLLSVSPAASLGLRYAISDQWEWEGPLTFTRSFGDPAAE